MSSEQIAPPNYAGEPRPHPSDCVCRDCCHIGEGHAPVSEYVRKLAYGISKAAIELACLRQELCLEDSPPLVVEQCQEIIDDIFKAMQGIDTCIEGPCEELQLLADALREERRKALEEAAQVLDDEIRARERWEKHLCSLEELAAAIRALAAREGAGK